MRRIAKRRIGFAAVAAVVALAAAAGPALAQGEGTDTAPRHGLALSQRANGLPGTEVGETIPQRLLIGAGSIRLEDTRPGGMFVIVRLAEEVLCEHDPALRVYVEKPFAKLRKQRLDAESEREEFRRTLLARLEDGRLEEAEVDQALAQKGLRRDGSRHLTVAEGAERVGPWSTRRYAIAVNDLVYLTVWVTSDIADYAAPPELYDFYDKVGLFPDDVTAALRRLQGFPVRIVANLDYFSAGKTVVSEIDAVQAWPVDPKEFESPAGFEKVERFPDPGTIGDHVCCECGQRIVGPVVRPQLGSPTDFACSRECAKKFDRKQR